jgi:hypothetical protein
VPSSKTRLRDTKLAKNISEVSAAFLKVSVLAILTVSRHTDECCSIIRESSQALRRTDRLRGSMHFRRFENQSLTDSCTNLLAMAHFKIINVP